MKTTPSDLIFERNQAFLKKDFGYIYDSFHSESNFRRQFKQREEYLAVGTASLSQDFHIVNCQVVDEKVEGDEAQVIFLMEMEAHGVLQKYAELAWLMIENDEWRYHRGLKVTEEDLPESLDTLTFEYFSKLDHSTVF